MDCPVKPGNDMLINGKPRRCAPRNDVAFFLCELCFNALVTVCINVIHYRHTNNYYVAGKAHPVWELAEEYKTKKGREENLRIIVN